MNEQIFFHWVLTGWIVIAIAIFILLFYVNAPYGRYLRSGWGFQVNNKLGWFIMEATSAVALFALFIIGNRPYTITAIVLLIMWEAHYIHRGFIYPFTLRGPTKQMPIIIVAFGLTFNLINAYLNGRYIFTLSGGYSNTWLKDPRFILGLLLFIGGYAINRQSDHILRKLRANGINGYKIPTGGLYQWISSPNYFGELIIWGGWALATWSLPGLAFAIWTAANLIPRARANHTWYKTQFADYPNKRRVLLPGLW
jgi:3-oxo-5-alpha-steroid 4-dehydrogenase 1